MLWIEVSTKKNIILNFYFSIVLDKLLILDPKLGDLTMSRFEGVEKLPRDRTGECCIILRWDVVRCEMLIVPSDSWFFAKLLTGGRLYKINGGTALRIPSSEIAWVFGWGALESLPLGVKLEITLIMIDSQTAIPK